MADPRRDPDPSSSGDGTTTRDLLALAPIEARELTALFKLLGDRTRLAILQILTGGERNVGTLCDLLGLPQPTVSHHLGLLRDSRLIDNRRAGKHIYYALNGRVSPAAVAGRERLRRTEGADEVLRDVSGDGRPDAPVGLQIKGRGFAVQILTADNADPEDAEA